MGIDLTDTHSKVLSEKQKDLLISESRIWEAIIHNSTREQGILSRYVWVYDSVLIVQKKKTGDRSKAVSEINTFSANMFYEVLRRNKERKEVWQHLHIRTQQRIRNTFVEKMRETVTSADFKL